MSKVSPKDLELRRTVLALDRQYLWHPYTEMGDWIEHSQPLVIKRGEGVDSMTSTAEY